MQIIIPQNINDLSNTAQQALCYTLFNPNDEEGIIRLVKALLLPTLGKKHYNRLLSQVPFSALWKHITPLFEQKLYTFPHIENLQAPAPYLEDLTIRQFSKADALYYQLCQSEFKNELYLRRLTASLYRFPNKEFDPVQLPQIATLTDSQPITFAYNALYAYACCREHIITQYPEVFKSNTNDRAEQTPTFKTKKTQYTPFADIVSVLAMENPQPLGNYQQCNTTRLYEFFKIFTDLIKRNRSQ